MSYLERTVIEREFVGLGLIVHIIRNCRALIMLLLLRALLTDGNDVFVFFGCII